MPLTVGETAAASHGFPCVRHCRTTVCARAAHPVCPCPYFRTAKDSAGRLKVKHEIIPDAVLAAGTK